MSRKVVIVTGATRGIGLATAIAIAKMGGEVALVARSKSDLSNVKRQVVEFGGEALTITCDVRSPSDCTNVILRTIEKFGQVDAIVNNAGTIEPIAGISEANPKEWMINWEANVLGPVILTKVAIPYLRNVNGRVINVSSGASNEAISGWGAYSMAKASINHFTKILAHEEKMITAIAFRPGVVDTAMQKTIRDKGELGMLLNEYEEFINLYKEKKLLSPEVPGRILAVLALYAPSTWSGDYISWDENRVQELVSRYY